MERQSIAILQEQTEELQERGRGKGEVEGGGKKENQEGKERKRNGAKIEDTGKEKEGK